MRNTSCDMRTCAAVPSWAKIATHQSQLNPFPAKSKFVTLKQNSHHPKSVLSAFAAHGPIAKVMLFEPSSFNLSSLLRDQISEVPSDLSLPYPNAKALCVHNLTD